MTPGSSGPNAPGRMGPGIQRSSSSSSSGGAVPKVKTRKKVASHANTHSLPRSQPLQYNPQVIPQQLFTRMHQHSPTNGSFQAANNLTPTICNGLPPSLMPKNISKNQQLFDWQNSENPSSPIRISCKPQALCDLYDSASDDSVSQDNRHIISSNSLRGVLTEVNGSLDTQSSLPFHRLRMNGQDTGNGASPSPSPSEFSSHCLSLVNGNSSDRSSRKSESTTFHSASDAKKINMSSSPDRAQVEHRLNQIHDYIKQTSSLIESYRLSSVGASSDDLNVDFLEGVLKDLYDSEAKLKSLLAAFDLISMEDDLKSSEAPGTENAGRASLPLEAQVNGNDHSVNAKANMSNSSDSRKQRERKEIFEESLKKLHTLQAEQSLLIQKRSEAQEQLQEARRARNILLAMSTNGCPVNSQGDSAPDVGQEEQATDTAVSSLQHVARLFTTMRGKTQVSPSRELAQRKRQPIESSQADVTTFLKELLTGDEVKEQASSEDSAVEDAMDEYAEARAQVRLQGQIVQDKVSEINALRAQLDQAKSLLNLAQKQRDTRSHALGNESADEAGVDQAVSLEQQRKGDGDAVDSSVGRKTKLSLKEQHLEQERIKLGKLRGLLATIQELRASGLPIPDHLLNEFGNEVQPETSRSTSPGPKEIQEEDAAVEADIEEDDEPESSLQWNQQQMSLAESASMARELSQGLQQRAAQLQVERDGLASMQRQLDDLFNELEVHRSVEKPTSAANSGVISSNVSIGTSSPSMQPQLNEINNTQESKRTDEAIQRRLELMSDLHNRWQRLQDEIALDGDLNVKAAPVLSAAQSALDMLASQILPAAGVAENNEGEVSWDQRSIQGRGHVTPRSERSFSSGPRGHQQNGDPQMSSAPSTLIRRKLPMGNVQNPRAVWSSPTRGDRLASENHMTESVRYNSVPSEESSPIVSLPSPSPTILQQQTQVMKNRFVPLSHSYQSLCMDSLEGVNTTSSLPIMPAVAIPPPPPPPLGSSSHDREAYYQQLLAAGQFQQHQVLLTAVNQCFHILKMQQHELLNLSNSLHMLSSGASHATPMGVHPGVHPVVHSGVHATGHSGVNASVAVHQGVHPGVHPGLLQNDEQWATPSPAPGPGPPTLNNQVPPGNRTNNYWDNFRSYSRQNLLSTSAKSNEGLPHSPSPLVERSHNSLRSSTPMSVPGPSSMSVASAMPHFHTPTQSCLPVMTQPSSLAESGGVPMGAMGPAPPSTMDFHNPPLVQNLCRKDKSNIEHSDGGLSSPRRRPSNEVDHRTASRVLENAELPINAQILSSPTSQDFEVPSMPLLRNGVMSLQSRLNQVNLNAAPSLVNFQDFIEAQNTRHQLNNEGVPFSEISTSIANQQLNDFSDFCTLDHARESSRRLNMDFHNGTSDDGSPNSSVVKRNTGAIKRTYTVPHGTVSNGPVYVPNYQRNIHSSAGVCHFPSTNISSNIENSNITSKLASVFPMSNSDSEAVFKSSKQPSSQDASRNFNSVGRRPVPQEDIQTPCSSGPLYGRSRMRGINEAEDHTTFQHDDTEYEDSPMMRTIGFNNGQSSTSSQISLTNSASNVDIHGFGPGKNQLKESCLQLRKCPKYQPKSESRSPLSDSSATATVSQNPSHLNVHRSASLKSQAGSHRTGNKNNQEFSIPNQMCGQGQLFEELRESVYAEMTSLISTNGGRSHFLVQLLRDLQHISSDSVRQSVLQLIQQAVSRYQIDPSVLGQDSFNLPSENYVGDDDEAKQIEFQRLEKDRLPYAGACSSSDVKTSSTSTQQGETLMQLVLGLELSAVLSANSDENCSHNLIDDVRERILQLIPVPQSSSVTSIQLSSSTRSPPYLHSQIDNVLESVFQKFQGRRIGDVRSEITSCVVSALPIRLMYRSIVDYYSRSNMEAEAHSRRDTIPSFRDTVESSTNQASPNAHQLPQHIPQMTYQDGEGANGDLAEADQSHHMDGVDGDGDSEADRDCSVDGAVLVSESPSTLLHIQRNETSEEMDSEPEVEALQEEVDAISMPMPSAVLDRSNCRNDLTVGAGGTLMSNAEKNGHEEASGSWSSEQDRDGEQHELEKERERELGLDQVPTRLASDNAKDQESGEKHRSHHTTIPPNDPSKST